jgi:hypothetical protein
VLPFRLPRGSSHSGWCGTKGHKQRHRPEIIRIVADRSYKLEHLVSLAVTTKGDDDGISGQAGWPLPGGS